MSRRDSIAGALDLAALELFAGRDRHRSVDRETMRVAIHELAGRGFGDYDIASATGVSVEYVRQLLGEPK